MRKFASSIEGMALLVISVGAVYFVAYTVYSDFKATKQRTLFYQLQILRMGVNIYQLLNHRNPGNLDELVTKTFRLPGDLNERRFVDGIAVDPDGRVFDPFGNPFFYDPLSGWVRSTTNNYEFW